MRRPHTAYAALHLLQVDQHIVGGEAGIPGAPGGPRLEDVETGGATTMRPPAPPRTGPSAGGRPAAWR